MDQGPQPCQAGGQPGPGGTTSFGGAVAAGLVGLGLDGETDHEQQDVELTRLLRAAASDDASAWGELVSRYGRRIFALAKSRCRRNELAEDVTQSVFLTLSQKLKTAEYEEQGRFEAWLFRIAMNRLRDVLRKERRRGEVSGVGIEENGGSARATGAAPMVRIVEGEAMDRLRDAMQQLADADREVIELRHHGSLSFKQIADVLDEPIGTLLARHHRALRKLKETLEAAGVAGLQESAE